jgi:hypothetical protein
MAPRSISSPHWQAVRRLLITGVPRGTPNLLSVVASDLCESPLPSITPGQSAATLRICPPRSTVFRLFGCQFLCRVAPLDAEIPRGLPPVR